MNPDRFRVFGVLTGRTRSGYEIPVARAQAGFDAVEGGLATTTLIFGLAAVRDSVLTGRFYREMLSSSLPRPGQFSIASVLSMASNARALGIGG